MANGGKREGAGRKKGSVGKVGAAVKDMILQTLDDLGGAEYLKKQAQENPNAFMTLLGKVIPTQMTGEDGGPIEFSGIQVTLVNPSNSDT